MRGAIALVLGFGLLSGAGCAVHVPEPTPEAAGGSADRLADLEAGYGLYRNKCSGCHSLFSVERFSMKVWEAQVEEMVRLKKVRIGPEERRQLLGYLSWASAQP
jgi:hypothetical protein